MQRIVSTDALPILSILILNSFSTIKKDIVKYSYLMILIFRHYRNILFENYFQEK